MLSRWEIVEPRFRVITDDDHELAAGLTLVEAVTVLDAARKRGQRVAIVDEVTVEIIDEQKARRLVAE